MTKIRTRLKELTDEIATKCQVTREEIVGMYRRASALAEDNDQPAGMNQAAAGLSRLAGLDAPEKREDTVTYKPSDDEQPDTGELMKRLRQGPRGKAVDLHRVEPEGEA